MKMTRYMTILLLLTVGGYAVAVDTLYDNRFKQWQAKAETGDTFSQYSLGNAYLRGNEVAIDSAKAIHWFSEAARKGHAKSQYKLGYMYYSGKGVDRDYGTAFDWFKLAANSNYSPAQFYLGRMYANGEGTNKDSDRALEWLNKALANEYKPAAKEIERLSSRRGNDSATTAKTQSSASNVIAKVSKPAPVKTVSKKKKARKGKLSVAELLLQGDWMMGDKPAEVLPSGLSECSSNASEVYCKTDEIHVTTDYADVNYKLESIAGRFDNNKKSFILKNKKNTLFVMPTDPDDPDVDPENIPATGISLQQMRCRFENDDKIRCFNDNFKKVYFTRE